MCTSQNLHTSSWSPSLAVSIRGVSDPPALVSLSGKRINVIAEGTGLAWCIFLCEELNLPDSGTPQRRVCCTGQSRSSCHRFWRTLGHRYHKLHRAYTGLLKGSKKEQNTHVTQSPTRKITYLLGFYCKYQKSSFWYDKKITCKAIPLY